MEQGQLVIVRVNWLKTLRLVLDDRVLPDRSSGQYESGWWAFQEGHAMAEDPAWFVSDEGIVYSHPLNEVVGKIVN